MIKPSPVGEPQQSLLSAPMHEVVTSWQQNKPKRWENIQDGWYQATAYMISATDYFIRSIEEKVDAPDGATKKATVIFTLSAVYDIIVPPLLPIWLKPFGRPFKAFVIGVLVSLLIDFMVGKYRKGNWVPPETPHEAPEDPTVERE